MILALSDTPFLTLLLFSCFSCRITMALPMDWHPHNPYSHHTEPENNPVIPHDAHNNVAESHIDLDPLPQQLYIHDHSTHDYPSSGGIMDYNVNIHVPENRLLHNQYFYPHEGQALPVDNLYLPGGFNADDNSIPVMTNSFENVGLNQGQALHGHSSHGQTSHGQTSYDSNLHEAKEGLRSKREYRIGVRSVAEQLALEETYKPELLHMVKTIAARSAGKGNDYIYTRLLQHAEGDDFEKLQSGNVDLIDQVIEKLDIPTAFPTRRTAYLRGKAYDITKQFADQYHLDQRIARDMINVYINPHIAKLLKNEDTFQTAAEWIYNSMLDENHLGLNEEEFATGEGDVGTSSSASIKRKKKKQVMVEQNNFTAEQEEGGGRKRIHRNKQADPRWYDYLSEDIGRATEIVANKLGAKADTVRRAIREKGTKRILFELLSAEPDRLNAGIHELGLDQSRGGYARRRLLGDQAEPITQEYMRLTGLTKEEARKVLNKYLNAAIADKIKNQNTFLEGVANLSLLYDSTRDY